MTEVDVAEDITTLRIRTSIGRRAYANASFFWHMAGASILLTTTGFMINTRYLRRAPLTKRQWIGGGSSFATGALAWRRGRQFQRAYADSGYWRSELKLAEQMMSTTGSNPSEGYGIYMDIKTEMEDAHRPVIYWPGCLEEARRDAARHVRHHVSKTHSVDGLEPL